MWLPLVLLLLLLALMASGSACPDLCECHPNDDIVAKENAPPALLDVACRGRVPSLSEMPAQVRSVSVDGAEAVDVAVFFDDLDTAAADLVANSLGMIAAGGAAADNLKTNDTSEMNGDENSTGSENGELRNTTETLPYLVELAVTNCSLVSLNASWHGLERLRSLNLSRNNLPRVRNVLLIRTMNLSELTCLDLSDNSLSDISVGSFRTLVGLARLSLRKNAIGAVHENAFRGLDRLEFLDLSDNRLADLPDSALTPLYSLQKLDLSGNQLQVLGARWFESLDRLRELDVSRNGLARAASGTLQPLSGLSVLRLAENPLKERDVSLLLGTGRRLETVDASRTGLARVPAALTRSVRALRLAGNRLTIIRSGDLDSYPLLRMLDIADNRLTDIENDALGRLEVLEELDLSGNVLSKVPDSLPASLTVLKLQRNAIVALQLDDLDGLYNLRSLILNDNNIGEIQVGALAQLPLLAELDLSDNPIKALSTNTLSGPGNLARLRMSGLTSLERHQEEQSDMAFPVPTPERLITLDVSRSPVLAGQLLADDAALSACKSLIELNLSATDISTVRSDLAYKLPQLRVLRLSDNNWNCTEDLYWLGEWIRQHREPNQCYKSARCSGPRQMAGLFLHELPPSPNFVSTTTTAAAVISTTTTTTTTTTASASPVTLSVVVVTLEHTSHTDQPNVTVSSNIGTSANSDRNLTDFPTLSLIRAAAKDVSAAARDVSATPKEAPRVYEAPTSFRNVTSSITMTRTSREPSRKSDKTNRISMDRNLIEHAVVPSASPRAPSDPKLSISRMEMEDAASQRSQTFDNRRRDDSGPTRKESGMSSKSPAVVDGDESVSSSEASKKTAEKYTSRVNATRENAVLDDRDAKTIAEELNSRPTDSGARVSEALSAGAHPGMLVLVGAALGAVAALTVVLSRRVTVHRTDRYHRHENIEVHTLTPTTELW